MFQYTLKKEASAPLSRDALRRLREWPNGEPDPQPAYMRSDEFDRIRLELGRYCRGELDGISFLIGGQRGAGKTTLAKLVIQQVIVDCDGSEDGESREKMREGEKDLIPMPLILHGPTIIDSSPAPQPFEAGNGPQPVLSKTDAAIQRALSSKEEALKQIIQALYRQLCETIHEAWRIAIHESSDARRSHPEMLELRAHLDLRLDGAPDADTLRNIWARAGFLNSGVVPYLRPVSPARGRFAAKRITVPPSIAGDPGNQGLREIVALAACAEAYWLILGKTSEKISNARRTDQQQQRGAVAPTETKGREDSDTKSADTKSMAEKGESSAKITAERLGPPALATVAGGFSLLANAQTGPGRAILAVLISALVWFFTWLVLGYDVKRRMSKDQRRERVTDIDWSPKRLERDFPGLLRRVKDAGLAPIFVLDELDKVPDVRTKMEDFLKYCKHIVTDHAAFMFLTNRDYFERLNELEYLSGTVRPGSDEGET